MDELHTMEKKKNTQQQQNESQRPNLIPPPKLLPAVTDPIAHSTYLVQMHVSVRANGLGHLLKMVRKILFLLVTVSFSVRDHLPTERHDDKVLPWPCRPPPGTTWQRFK